MTQSVHDITLPPPPAGEVKFPPGFEALREYADWVLWTEAERVEKQVTTSVEDLAAFYHGVFPHLGAMYDHLAEIPIEAMSDEDRTLLCLAISLMEIANGVEYYSPDSTAAEAMPRFACVHDSLLGWRGAPPEEDD